MTAADRWDAFTELELHVIWRALECANAAPRSERLVEEVEAALRRRFGKVSD